VLALHQEIETDAAEPESGANSQFALLDERHEWARAKFRRRTITGALNYLRIRHGIRSGYASNYLMEATGERCITTDSYFDLRRDPEDVLFWILRARDLAANQALRLHPDAAYPELLWHRHS